MLFLLAPAAAGLIAIANQDAAKHRHHRHAVQPRMHSRDYMRPADEAALRRRVARMTRLALLQRREALLHDFLLAATTESPGFRDDRTYRLESGIAIGPAQLTQDFIGSPIIRARVANLKQMEVSALLLAQISSAAGRRARAGIVVSLHPGEIRTVELLCPEKIAPASLIWSTMPL